MQFEKRHCSTIQWLPTDRKVAGTIVPLVFDLPGIRPLHANYLDDVTGEFPRIDDRRAVLPAPRW